MFLSIIMIIVAALLALVVLMQNPKGGGLAAGFGGAQQIGGVQRTADFLEKSTWTLAAGLMFLCIISGVNRTGAKADPLDQPITAAPDAKGNPANALPPDTARAPLSGTQK